MKSSTILKIALSHFISLLLLCSCTNTTHSIISDGLTKLTEEEMVDRARQGIYPDQEKMTYILTSGDTIPFDSLQKINQLYPIALDDYVDTNGAVVMSVVRKFRETDKKLRARLHTAYMENRVGDINGELSLEPVKSEFLQENRYLSIYLPKNINDKTDIIYLMDGGFDEPTIKKIDDLIADNQIAPLIMVGVENSTENRFKEYVYSENHSEYFDNHMNFFTKEVISYIENENLSKPREQENRYISGNSNGGDFSIFCALKNPKLFNEAISFSGTALKNKLDLIDLKNADKTSSLYMGAGSQEVDILRNNKEAVSILKSHDFDLEFIEYDSGHDREMWKKQFINYVTDRFKYSDESY